MIYVAGKKEMEGESMKSTGTSGVEDAKLLSLLAYIFSWVGGLLVFLIAKDKFAKFHAMQSLILGVLGFLLSFVTFGLLGLLLWIYGLYIGIVHAYKGKMYKAPVIGDYAEKWSR